MKKEELLRYTGSIQQVAYARRICYDEGRARGLNAVEVRNGPLSFVVMLDKCLDVSEMCWRGEQVSFLSKPGLNGRNPFDTHGGEAQRSIMGGLFFTCGYENICAPFENGQGKAYPMHGRMRTSPAEHVAVMARWEDDDYVISISGDIREAELFGENLVLHRVVTTRLSDPSITVTDEITNEGFRDEPMMLMYHCNLGYPFLSENVRLIIPSKKITARDKVSEESISRWQWMDPPKDNETECVYLHELHDRDGKTFAAAVDDRRQLGICISWDRNQLPCFGQWKSTASGDYVMGLEPGNAPVYGRQWCEAHGCMPIIKAQSTVRTGLSFRMIEGTSTIAELEECARQLNQ